ncbi:bifunctional DNA-formamidopyrimidine glycosylase/DNA-(apurinic or apyrimidinic site) lyase [Actinomyces lilanjuaniae]|uniref:Bifunctional DNA-formamidopyrimidine glycosylase/DNA-(Apurinic or apyrimidinic site) lyase n=1 Tax=Actinomyces lilanjuaniae TaxID=2321394 RepID=A0ABN5PT04_9ACTO|nr:bifunctional DNA-formamidopyrimidine glycosylase/DNA-(apurinic or apyrimidinic site) lyase [Actinomyces lilanjuaniae]AYD90903.1 bifunctional DNA-formamidopyrimidine glycosylase/DNA-(apurinic or apyrimidinic site) lyase [Actinomyces lilanjuaniae]
MPELPEVEVVRAGLERHLRGRRVTGVEVLDPRPLRRQVGGAEGLRSQLVGRTLEAVVRRGKFLWAPLGRDRALSVHLGMSGQLLVRDGEDLRRCEPGSAEQAPSSGGPLSQVPQGHRHLRLRLHLGPQPRGAQTAARLDLVDQRMLGGMHVAALVPTCDGAPGGRGSSAALLPADTTHVARDLLDPDLDRSRVVERVRASRRAIKTLLLDQGIVSGVGNIYADEGLWYAGVHGARPGTSLEEHAVTGLLEAVAQVMDRALEAGGTSFDELYVDAEGSPGYFARALEAYGRAGQPCHRCRALMQVERIGGRSHTYCPCCQR